MSLRLDPNNPEHRKLLEKSEGGKKGLKEYYSGNKSAKKLLRAHDYEKNLNQEDQTHNTHRIDNLNTTRKTTSSMGRLKYGNKVCYDELYKTDQKFDSMWERTCFYRLMELQRKGIIRNLETQVKIALEVHGEHICNFIIDFRFTYENTLYYVDAKSIATVPVGARLKIKLFRIVQSEHLYLAYSSKSSIIDTLEGKTDEV